MNEMPAKTPKARASPLGSIRDDRLNRPPDTNGPTARPAADRVWARPLRAPKTAWSGADLVICGWICYYLVVGWQGYVRGRLTSSSALVNPPTVAIVFTSNTEHSSKAKSAVLPDRPPESLPL